MALVICPECNKEISDKVKSCPHCGFPIVEDVSSTHEPLKVNVTSFNLNQLNKAKIQMILYKSIFFILIIGGLIAYIVYQNNLKIRNKYIVNLNLIATSMLSGAGDAEELCNLSAKVWRNTIFKENDFETNKYTHSGYGFNSDFNGSIANSYEDEISSEFNSDFNISLKNLFDDRTIQEKVKSIEFNQALASSFMKDLRNPSLEFEKCYNTLNEMFTQYMGLTDLAISPRGSLQTFIQSKSEKVEKFMGYYRTLKTQIPEKR